MNFYGILAIIISFAISLSLMVCENPTPSVVTDYCAVDTTPTAAPIIEKPEPIQTKKELSADILFDFNRHKLTKEGKKQLDQLISEIKPETTITVIGHTDKIGKSRYNQKLSEKRALAVVQYLKPKVDNEFQFVGVGSSISSGETDDCRKYDKKCFQPDRRITIEFQNKD